MSDKQDRGWGQVLNGRKWHFFDGFRSLCGKYGYFGSTSFLYDSNHESAENCVACKRAHRKTFPELYSSD